MLLEIQDRSGNVAAVVCVADVAGVHARYPGTHGEILLRSGQTITFNNINPRHLVESVHAALSASATGGKAGAESAG